MPLNTEQVDALKAPLDRAHVKTREQSGVTLSYIEGWWAIAEANRIFGFDGWTRETVDIKCVSERERTIGRPPNTRDGWGVTYTAKVRVTVGDIVREGVGTGHGVDVQPGQAHESAIKEAETDAMKRALMTFGNPFGLALYDKQQTNVASNGNGKVQHDSRSLDWRGPLTKTGLTKDLRAFAAALADKVHIPEELDNLLEEYGQVIEQCKKDMPGWWTGEGMNADFVPLEQRIEAKRSFLTAANNMRAG